MEAAGLAIGVAGLASAFTSCVEVINLVQLARSSSKDQERLAQRVENQKLRFALWGESIYLNEPQRSFLKDQKPQVYNSIYSTMMKVRAIFGESDNLMRRYGLVHEPGQWIPNQAGRASYLAARPLDRLVRRVTISRSVRNKSTSSNFKQGGQPSSGTIRWVVADRTKFEVMVKDLRDFIDDLEALTSSVESIRRRHQLLESGLAELPQGELAVVAEAFETEEVPDEVSDAASMRLEVLSGISTRGGSVEIGSYGGSVQSWRSSMYSFHTAPESWTHSFQMSQPAPGLQQRTQPARFLDVPDEWLEYQIQKLGQSSRHIDELILNEHTWTEAEDIQEVRRIAEERWLKPCTQHRAQKQVSQRAVSSNQPHFCIDCVMTYSCWRRRCDEIAPRHFSRCRICSTVVPSRLDHHLKRHHGLEDTSRALGYSIDYSYDPLYTARCDWDSCEAIFSGTRFEALEWYHCHFCIEHTQ